MDLLHTIIKTLDEKNVSETLSHAIITQTPNNKDTITTIMQKVLPLFGDSLKKNASDTNGLSSLLGAITKNHRGELLEKNATSIDSNALQNDGGKIIKHIFGKEKDNVIQQVSKETKQDSNMIGNVISLLAPFVMDSLGSNIHNTSDNSLMKIAGTFLDQNNDGSISDDLINIGKKFFS